MPRLEVERFGGGDQSWLGSTHGIGNCRTATLDVSAFTASTHYPNGYIPSGTPLNVADEGAATPYTGEEGEQLGFLFTDQRVVGDADIPAPVLRHGTINVGRLPATAAGFEPPADGAFVFVGGAA